MATWTREELDQIGTAEELRIAPLRCDGAPRKPVTIWAVRVGDDLYVRSAHGRRSAWFRGVQIRHEGEIHVGGVVKVVTCTAANPNLKGEIDAAYRTKYRRHGATYVNMMVSPEARSTTIKLTPRSASS
jgi:hypothetical protein